MRSQDFLRRGRRKPRRPRWVHVHKPRLIEQRRIVFVVFVHAVVAAVVAPAPARCSSSCPRKGPQERHDIALVGCVEPKHAPRAPLWRRNGVRRRRYSLDRTCWVGRRRKYAFVIVRCPRRLAMPMVIFVYCEQQQRLIAPPRRRREGSNGGEGGRCVNL